MLLQDRYILPKKLRISTQIIRFALSDVFTETIAVKGTQADGKTKVYRGCSFYS